MKPERVLVLGGQRSGKSAYAESLVRSSGLSAVYVATAALDDDTEMAARIALHRGRRGKDWRTVEEPLEVPAAVARESGPGFHVLVDCLTVWLSNLMAAENDIDAASAALVAALSRATGPVVLVSGEVGLGIVPDNALARRFADHLGRLNQTVAAVADRVVFVAAGLPVVLKSEQSQSEVII